ncbi:MAG: tetraacyldisaccharide 4'-kinase [Acidiferrobacteraceae bacterium]
MRRTWLSRALWPLSMLYCVFFRAHRQFRSRSAVMLPVPAIIVGNVTVGGTGKTPLTAWIGEWLVHAGYRPGIVSRGYGGRARKPQEVLEDSDPLEVGDEPVLLARRSLRVAVGADRVAAAQLLIEQRGCDVIVSDDGLQHWRLRPDVAVAVIDGQRRFGNGFCLPAGPLREPAGGLCRVDVCVVQGGELRPGEWGMRLVPGEFVNLADRRRTRTPADFVEPVIHAVAGIGHPARFFEALRSAGVAVRPHAFADHHRFSPADFAFADAGSAVIMTEKDAVKCERFARDNFWFLRVTAEPETGFGPLLLGLLKRASRG